MPSNAEVQYRLTVERVLLRALAGVAQGVPLGRLLQVRRVLEVLTLSWYDYERMVEVGAGRFTARPGSAIGVTDGTRVRSPVGGVNVRYASSDAAVARLDRLPRGESYVARATEIIRQQIAVAEYATLAAATQEDPAAMGWVNIPEPDACWFCLMLASNGVMSRGRATAVRHDNCRCRGVPVFSEEQYARPEFERVRRLREEWRAGGHTRESWRRAHRRGRSG